MKFLIAFVSVLSISITSFASESDKPFCAERAEEFVMSKLLQDNEEPSDFNFEASLSNVFPSQMRIKIDVRVSKKRPPGSTGFSDIRNYSVTMTPNCALPVVTLEESIQ